MADLILYLVRTTYKSGAESLFQSTKSLPLQSLIHGGTLHPRNRCVTDIPSSGGAQTWTPVIEPANVKN